MCSITHILSGPISVGIGPLPSPDMYVGLAVQVTGLPESTSAAEKSSLASKITNFMSNRLEIKRI